MNNELQEYIAQSNWDQISLVDLGCWSGRLSEILTLWNQVHYTWVDNAPWMIDVAKQQYTWSHFICDDMINFANESKQESIDFLIALASIQHLQWVEKQQEVLLWIYKSLKRWWKVVLVNRSFSKRFVWKYWKNIMEASRRSVIKDEWSWNDLLIDRKDKSYHTNETSYKRMYHIYTLHELKKLCQLTGFVIEKSWYIYQDWSFWSDWKKSRNSVLVLKKGIQ